MPSWFSPISRFFVGTLSWKVRETVLKSPREARRVARLLLPHRHSWLAM
jgi:hypothetical protein